jgi:hypothetical protein
MQIAQACMNPHRSDLLTIRLVDGAVENPSYNGKKLKVQTQTMHNI